MWNPSTQVSSILGIGKKRRLGETDANTQIFNAKDKYSVLKVNEFNRVKSTTQRDDPSLKNDGQFKSYGRGCVERRATDFPVAQREKAK